jgi:hypothetical protein
MCPGRVVEAWDRTSAAEMSREGGGRRARYGSPSAPAAS